MYTYVRRRHTQSTHDRNVWFGGHDTAFIHAAPSALRCMPASARPPDPPAACSSRLAHACRGRPCRARPRRLSGPPRACGAPGRVRRASTTSPVSCSAATPAVSHSRWAAGGGGLPPRLRVPGVRPSHPRHPALQREERAAPSARACIFSNRRGPARTDSVFESASALRPYAWRVWRWRRAAYVSLDTRICLGKKM